MNRHERMLLRKLTITLLDDGNDVTYLTWGWLKPLLEKAGHHDILEQVDTEGGKVCLPENARLLPEDRT